MCEILTTADRVWLRMGQLTVDINGSAIGGSPFPVFFSPPEERPAGDSNVLRDAAGQAVDATTVSSANANMPMPVISILVRLS